MTDSLLSDVTTDRGETFPVRRWGMRGLPMILHHATGFCKEVWDPVARELAAAHVVYAFDARGHGDGPPVDGELSWERYSADLADVSRAIARCAGFESFAGLIGHSLGGVAGLTAAVAEPQLFRRLLLVEPVLIPGAGCNARQRGRSPFSVMTRMRRARFDSRRHAREVLSETPPYSRFSPEVFDAYLETCWRDLDGGEVGLKCSPELEAAIYEFGPTKVLDGLDGFHVPTRIVAANRGDFLAAYTSLRIHRWLEVVEVDSSHLVPMEDPHTIVDLARSWFKAGG